MHKIILFIIATINGSLCTWAIRSWAIKKNIVNKPNPIVPQHTKPIAYLGGVGVYGGICLSVLADFFFFTEYNQHFYLLPGVPLLIGATGFLILGILDDLYTYSALRKIIWQSVLALLSASLGIKYSFFNIPVVDFLFSALWIVIIVNAANLTDVCDGLVGGLCVFIFLATSFFNSSLSVFAIIIAGATLGFLFFNFPKASIFLGDAGSHLLGFLLAALCFLEFPHTDSLIIKVSWMALLPGVMLFELLFLIVVRTRKGLHWWKGSPDHFSLRLQSAGFSRLQTDLIAWSFNVVFIVTACSLQFIGIIAQCIILASILLMLFFAWKYLLTKEVKFK